MTKYIVGYNAAKLKVKWYVSNINNPMQKLTNAKSVFFVVIWIIVTLTIMIIEYKFFYKNCISQQNSNR